ncbi:MAG: hypothetical protein K0V04_11550, partial [Deltaproteobacteria bacterium]|nr:hypothetical protein [Deltaproteobacteria bacterium]
DVPPVATITRSEFEELLRADEAPTEQEQRADAQRATALRMLALLPAGQSSSDEAAIAAYASNVLAFYTRSNATVTIVETNLGDVSLESSVAVLSHEFVHAQQDVDVDLQDFFDANVDSADSLSATRSITEGEAVLHTSLTMARQPGAYVDAELFERFFSAQQQSLRESAAGEGEAAAQYTDISSSFPYPFGGQLVTDVWLADGNAAVLDLYDSPPGSTAAVLRTLAGREPGGAVEPPPLGITTVPDGWSVVAEDVLGAWILFAVARRSGFVESSATAMAEDWAGDRIFVLGGATEAEAAMAWSIRFGTEDLAEQFAGIQDAVPPEGVRAVEVDGRDVTLIMAPDDDMLELALGTFEAAVVEPGQSFVAPGTPQAGPLIRRSFDGPRGHRGHRH